MDTQIKIELPPTVEVDQVFPLKVTTDQASALTIAIDHNSTPENGSEVYKPTYKEATAVDAEFATKMIDEIERKDSDTTTPSKAGTTKTGVKS